MQKFPFDGGRFMDLPVSREAIALARIAMPAGAVVSSYGSDKAIYPYFTEK